jgi:hypothetical protein
MPARTTAVAIIVCLLSAPVGADGTDDRRPTDSQHTRKKAQDPSMRELLEFLGQWETDDGHWIDPTDTDWLITPNQESNNED